jgi:hypothetical protein
MSSLLTAISASQVNTRRFAGYIFARADGIMRKLWPDLRNTRSSSSSDPPVRRGGWHTPWAESVSSVKWTDAAEEKWRRANPTLHLDPHLLLRNTQPRIPKRKLEDDSSRQTHHTPSFTLTTTPDAPRRLAAGTMRNRRIALRSDDPVCRRRRTTWASRGRMARAFTAATDALSITIGRRSNQGYSRVLRLVNKHILSYINMYIMYIYVHLCFFTFYLCIFR